MVIVSPAVMVSVVMMLGFMRTLSVFNNNRTAVLLVNNSVAIVLKVVFPAVDIPHVTFVDVPGCGVVEELVSAPFTALKAVSGIAIAVANPTVITDVRSPVACVEAVVAGFPSPISRSPEHAGRRWPYPGACGPVIAPRAVCPVAGSPQIARARANWLGIDGDRRGSDVD
jgi:hypothetical protein